MKGYFSGQDVGVWLRRVRAMSWKELLQLWRDPVLLLFIVYAFTLDIYNAGSGVTLQLNNAAFAVLDTDRSAASRELAARFLPPYFNPLGQVSSGDQGLSLLDNGKALFVLDIPPQFEASLQAGRSTAVQMQVDATNSVLATLASADATEITAAYGLEQAAQQLGGASALSGAPILSNATRVWFNPNQNDAWFMAISELLNVITVFGLLLPAAAMVREKERGTIEQLVVSPLTCR
jgi:ABC-2 type transport system permease protein